MSVIKLDSNRFPLDGVIGIVANGQYEVDQAIDYGLSCIEVRPDLLFDHGMDRRAVMALIRHAKSAGLGCLFTYRRADHGGKFVGSHKAQYELSLEAVDHGADVVDLEWDSDYAQSLIAQGVVTILSHHDFNGTPDTHELSRITRHISDLGPRAIKLIPTATSFNDAIEILKWVKAAQPTMPRIGFAMGAMGEFSRILARSLGSPITYCNFGKTIAPGQISVDQALSRYRAQGIHSSTRVVGVMNGEEGERMGERTVTEVLDVISRSWRGSGHRLVGVPLQPVDGAQIIEYAGLLNMDYIMLPKSQASRVVGSIKNDEEPANMTAAYPVSHKRYYRRDQSLLVDLRRTTFDV